MVLADVPDAFSGVGGHVGGDGADDAWEIHQHDPLQAWTLHRQRDGLWGRGLEWVGVSRGGRVSGWVFPPLT